MVFMNTTTTDNSLQARLIEGIGHYEQFLMIVFSLRGVLSIVTRSRVSQHGSVSQPHVLGWHATRQNISGSF